MIFFLFQKRPISFCVLLASGVSFRYFLKNETAAKLRFCSNNFVVHYNLELLQFQVHHSNH
jgi:hypothetical protein